MAKKTVNKEIKAAQAQVVDASDVTEMLPVSIAGQSLTGMFKEFKTGSKGWNINGKIMVDGHKCQVSGNVVIIGSKPADKATK